MKNNAQPFALIFDMDGTMIDSNPTHKEAFERFFAQYDIEMTDEDFINYVSGRMNPDIMKHFFGDAISSQKITALTREKELLFQELFAPKIKPIKGLLPFLKKAREKGIPMALATSAPKMNIEFVFTHIPLSDYFPHIVHDRNVKKGKPAPEIFLKAARKLRYPPERCIVFEDSKAGVEAAQAAGMTVVVLTTTHSAGELEGADWVINDFSEATITKLNKLASLKEKIAFSK
ncbi:HAD family hydrolase [Nibrella saemangeumensis]|uniref:Beta-phosphoglucomutase n=1 Tax=Nibrella saemangeumensis TaxID=1084526 RepID=A0ABP8N124_9BACT